MSGVELAQVRFAISPAIETLYALEVLRHPGRHAVHLPWVSWARPRLAGVPHLPLLTALLNTKIKPIYLVPGPDTRMPDIHQEMEQIRSTPPAVFTQRLVERHDGSLDARVYEELRAAPADGLRRIADGLLACFEAVVEPHWGRIRAVLEADISHRAALLSEGGIANVFAGLHRQVSWRDGVLLVDDRPSTLLEVDLAGRGLMLNPSVFCWPEVWINIMPVTDGSLRYPARGLGTLWETRPDTPPAVASLIGRTRAELLELLEQPRTTGELAGLLTVSSPAVSQHLGILRGAGLVTSRRTGRQLFHLRTERGDLLISPP